MCGSRTLAPGRRRQTARQTDGTATDRRDTTPPKAITKILGRSWRREKEGEWGGRGRKEGRGRESEGGKREEPSGSREVVGRTGGPNGAGAGNLIAWCLVDI